MTKRRSIYALTLNVTASPADKTYANQLKGTPILEPIFKRQPRHPGVAHYLIHLYDYPAIAEKGLDAARRYAEIAPAAPHAQHMPSHIFTRVGYWQELIASNGASAQAAKQSKDFDEQMHAMDYMVYAYLQQAQDNKARSVIAGNQRRHRLQSECADRTLCDGRKLGSLRAWSATIGKGGCLHVRPTKFPYVDAITHFARALGAARSGNPTAAQRRRRKIGRAARPAAAGKGSLLGRASRHPTADRERVDPLCRWRI